MSNQLAATSNHPERVTLAQAEKALAASGLDWTFERAFETLDYRMADQQVIGNRSIWLGCLSAYNSGRLHGAWIYTGGIDADELSLFEAYIRTTSPMADSEELDIFDSSEYPSFIQDTFEMLEFEEVVTDHAVGWQVDAYAAMCENEWSVVDWDRFEDLYIQEGEVDADFIEEWYIEAGYETPDHLLGYIDWDAMARDRLMDTFDQVEYQGSSYIFHMG